METAVFACWLLFLLFSPAVPTCLPTDFTLYVEREECDYCVAINTSICAGFCYSRDSNAWGLFGSRFMLQTSCTYNKVEYRTAVLPGCPTDANAVFTYPAALSCHCGTCKTETGDCVHRAGLVDGPRCTKPVRRVYPYPGNYMIPL